MPFLRIVLLAVLCLSCGLPRYYTPSVQVPLLRKKGDFQATAAASTSGTELQAAYALKNHLAVAVSTSLPGYQEYEEKSAEFYGALGIFSPIGSGGSLEFYGGSGGGRYNVAGLERSLLRSFGQINLGYQSKILEAAIVTCLAYTSLGSAGADYPAEKFTTLEPGLTLRLGYDYLKAESQLVLVLYPLQKTRTLIIPLVFHLGLASRMNFSGE